jgi:uncharacterized protein involved in exopolysaccharide biosynthesis
VTLQRLVSTLLVAAGIALCTAACGGGPSAEEKWAGSVCSSVTDWKTTVQQSVADIQSTLQSPKAGMVATIESDVSKAVDATHKLASDLKSVGTPNTEGGTQAKQQLDSLTTQLETTAKNAQQAAASVPSDASATETVKAFVPLAPALQAVATKTSNALAAVQDAGKSLKDGFAKADAGKPYRR